MTQPIKTLQEIVGESLSKLLAEMQAMEPLPSAGSPEALANHENWMKRHREITSLYHKALYRAMHALPTPVRDLLDQIQEQEWKLLNFDQEEQQADPDEEKNAS
ncbi:MAG: hypothetical protein E6J34_14930 [Chloroflexi bacterium]|nr:MAG: hypothetical protein E6J34_14930 [Chloroflexota bacterium]